MNTVSCMPTRMVTVAIPIAILLLSLTAVPAHAQTFHVIYSFTGCTSAVNPIAGVTVDQRGNLYGVVYEVTP